MNERVRVRIAVLRVLAISLLVTLGARLWVLQVLDGAHYQQVAETNRVRAVVTPAPRGMILDDQGQELVRNRTTLVISVNRSVTDRQRDHGKAVFQQLSPVIGMSVDDIEQKIRFCGPKVSQPCWTGSPYQPVPVAKDVAPAQALAIIEHPDRFPGVTADLQAVRQYPYGPLAAHELGYLAPVSQTALDDQTAQLKKQGKPADSADATYHLDSLVGVAGLESVYDSMLRGKDGVDSLEVDRFGRVSGTLSNIAAVPGDNLVLNLDQGVQAAAEQALQSTLQSLPALPNGQARTASAVVLDVQTGGVVALASLPSYDPSVFSGGISEKDYQALSAPANGTPLLSRAYQGSGPAGSTFKVVSTATAMARLGAGPDQTFPCSPTLQLGGQTFHNYDGESAGPITLHQALVISCDVIFDQFAFTEWLRDGGLRNGKGPYQPAAENFATMAKAMGFGSRTGIDLPGETAGAVVDRAGAQQIWNELKGTYCARAKNGYPEVSDPATAQRYQQYAAEACTDGYLYNGGAAAQFAIGQGQYLSVSPLQLAEAYAAIANGGTLYQPQLAKAVIAPDGTVVRRFQPIVTGKLPVPPDVLGYIREALHGVTTEPGGTGAGVFSDWPSNVIPIGGKTGTAEVEGHKDTSWFASFAPVSDPRYVVVAQIPDSGTGATYAAPVVKAIYQAIFGVGRPAALPGGLPPSQLPSVARASDLNQAPSVAGGPAVGAAQPTSGVAPDASGVAGTGGSTTGPAPTASPPVAAGLAGGAARAAGQRAPPASPAG
jgi:penicillin-binding protein 2